MADFITRITAPTLGSATFATDLREVFKNIDDNFKKIVSAPYLEGQEGKSLDAYDMPIVENGELTEFGAAMVREILSDPSIRTIQDIINNPIYNSVGPAQHTVYECLMNSPTMKVFRTIDPDTGETDRWICSSEYYYFIDMRIEDLGNCGYPSSMVSFIDYSCLVFGEWNGSEWIFSKGNMIPTLYYSSDQGCFCWKVNGFETGIRAQGVKGDDGRPPKAAVVKGFGSVSDIGGTKILNISVTDYSVFNTHVAQGGEVFTEATWADVHNSGLLDGDLVVCIFDTIDPTYQVSYPDMVIGNIRIIGTVGEPNAVYTITCPDSNRFSSLWRSYLLFYAFRDVDYKSTDTKKTKALFIPTSSQGMVHAIFQDDSGVVYQRQPDGWTTTDTKNNSDLVFKKVIETKLIGSGSVGSTSIMSKKEQYDYESAVRFSGYRVEIDGTAKAEVSGSKGVLLGVPVGSIVNWMDAQSIPDGWYVCGETSEYTPPVFGMKMTESEDYDVVVQNTYGDILGKFIICKADQDGIGDRDARFANIFCTLSGVQKTTPIVIETEKTTIEEYIEEDGFGWSMFDFGNTSDGIVFYLTKLVQDE